MSLSTNLISGLSSGFDWRSMIDQIIQIDRKPIELVEGNKSEYEEKISAWQSFNTKLLSLKTAAEAINDPEDFYLYTSNMTTDDSTVEASDLISVSMSTSATIGSYSIKVSSLAAAQKLSSAAFSSISDSLGASYAGDILINGSLVTISTSDTLADVRDRINNANAGSTPSGVTASIVNYGDNDYRLMLSSDATGLEGIGLLNGGGADILAQFGLIDTTRTAKNHIIGADKSDAFTSSTTPVKTLLGLNTTQTSANGDIIISENGIDAIDLSSDTLTSIKDKFVSAGIDASIISKTEDGATHYYILIEGGSNTYTDKNNILETLGILKGGVSDVKGVTGDVANTSGGEVITASTLIKEIDGYTDHETDDYIYLAGTDTDGSGVGPDTTFTITDDKTIGDLLTKIEDLFGDVTASVTGDGEVMVIDNTGGSDLSLQIAVKDADTSDDDTLNFDANDDMGSAATTRKRQLVAGLDASIVVDGVTISKSENIVDDVISGVTLNLLNADQDTTVTLTVDRDVDSTIDKISTVVDNYNTIIAYIYEQQSYDADNETTGGILFGDNTLSLIKSQLTSVMLEPIWGVSSNFSTMGLAGINVDNEGQLSINSSTLKGYLETNFNDMKLLFAASGTTDTGSLEYISHTRDSNAGEYSVDITQAATLASETGTTSLGTLSGAETLTISDGSQTATVSLENGDTLTEIVSEINTELDTVYTETLAGVNILYEGSGESTLADAGTTWSQLYVGAGTANLVNNDEIHFDGTTRSGTVVSSYYTISNASTDTVQGLLSAIESAYSNKIAASINSSGRIVLTDKYSGTSDLSITFDYDQTENQVDLFGTVLTTNTGGQEGRYAIGVTASDDGSNHLVLTHDNYGSGSSFTISQSGDTNIQEIVYSDTAKTTSVSSGQIYASGSTTWDGIYDTTVNTTDTITITGTTHGNDAVGPTAYNIYSAAYKDIDSLLSAIEAAFTAAGGSVDARIEDGKIIVEDQVSGDGSTSLTLTYNNEGSGSDLDMGTIDQTTDRDLDLGLVNGTFSGLDVVGTINGESATGSGQILTGDEDENNVDGLSIRYTGTDTGAIGDVTLTLGVAEAFERTLYAITDSLEGYVANKEESLQNSIDSFESLIERMEARLEQKMEMMINRFVAMELALSKIQSQSDWLSGQIDAANSGWI